MYSSLKLIQNEKKTAQIIYCCNSTNFGDDVVKMARKYSVQSASRRWSMKVFFNISDVAVISAWVVFKEKTCSNISRRDCILKVAEELREKYIAKEAEVIRAWTTPTNFLTEQQYIFRYADSIN